MAGLATPSRAEFGSVAVAYSGGRDSTALLHATAQQAKALNDAGASIEVLALHVHHGLSRNADDWLGACRQQCEKWAHAGLPLKFQFARLQTQPDPSHSVEAWAREQRYAALAAMAKQVGAELILLAHHRRDQAETLLLQGLRGAGVAGLAGMPARQWRDGLCWARPWLGMSRQAVEAYVGAYSLTHIEDDSNSDPRFARNRLRLAIWPGLLEAFPQAEASLAQAATWAQQSLALQQEVASADLAGLVDEAGLALQGLLALSSARASNALRAWLALQLGQPAPTSLVQRLLLELPQSDVGSWRAGGGADMGTLRLYRGRLQWFAQAGAPASAHAVLPVQEIDLSRPGVHPVPSWAGAWQVERVSNGGVALAHLRALSMKPRLGGEQFQLHPNGILRSLKKVYQAQAVPAWRRTGPLLFLGEDLLFVPGLGLSARFRAADGVAQVALSWHAALD